MSAVSAPRSPRSNLHELTSVREAHVFKGDRIAAVMRRLPDGVEFRYLPEYLPDRGQAVATTLPLSDTPTLTPAGAVAPYFAGIFPEGRRLSNLRRAVKTSADDDLSLLLAVGADTVGNVTILPVGEVPHEPQPLVVADRDFDQLSFEDLLDSAGVIDPVALAGNSCSHGSPGTAMCRRKTFRSSRVRVVGAFPLPTTCRLRSLTATPQ